MPAEGQLLVEAWKARDDLYRQLLGDFTSASPARYAPPELPSSRYDESALGGGTSDPGNDDQRLSVLTYAPDPLRPYWMYITSGLSNPWYQDEPAEVSGFGLELIIKCPTESLWPAQILRTMALYVFNYAATISPGVRIALNGPISVNTESDLRNLIVWYTDEAPRAWYQLPSGGFGLFTVIGVTEDECRFAESIEEYGTWCIQEVLRQVGIGQVTDPLRKSVMNRPDINSMVQSLKTYAENFPIKPRVLED